MDIHRVMAGDGTRIRELRLRALREDPYAFSASFEHVKDYPPETWEELATHSELGQRSVVFVAVDDDGWVGMAGGYVSDDNPSMAGLWGMWVAPVARRRGLGRRLVEAIVDWARTQGASRLDLSVSERAKAAAALYRRLGFAPTGEQQPLASDPRVTEIALTRPL